jgi:hypothetical protein
MKLETIQFKEICSFMYFAIIYRWKLFAWNLVHTPRNKRRKDSDSDGEVLTIWK